MAFDEYAKRDFKVVGTRPLRPDGIDKVTGRALYGADLTAPGMLVGRILRSPHAHARILSIDTTAAEALPGVKAVVTSADFGVPDDDFTRDIQDNCLARGKALYDGHAVAAVAATSPEAAKAALAAIEVSYEVLPHVTEVDAAMKPGAPVVQEGRVAGERRHRQHSRTTSPAIASSAMATPRRALPGPTLIVERSFTTQTTHQGYIEPHACLASMGPDGRGELWCCTQGQFLVRTRLRRHSGDRGQPAARHRLGNRRRLRRQDHGVHRAGRAGAQPQGRADRSSS